MRIKNIVFIICLFFSGCLPQIQESELIHDRYLNKRFCLGHDDNRFVSIWLFFSRPYDSLVSADEQLPRGCLQVFKKPEYLAFDSNIVLAERIRGKTKIFFIGTARWGNSKYLWFTSKDSLQFVSEKKRLGVLDSLKLRKRIRPQSEEQVQKRKPVNIGNWSR